MLEKNDFFFCDIHFHYLPAVRSGAFSIPNNWTGCSCAHSKEEWEEQFEYSQKNKLILSYGIHPQQLSDSAFNIDESFNFLEMLLKNHELAAIGECGFDFFTDEYKKTAVLQEEVFNRQISLALNFNKGVIIHCRKANEKLFEYSKVLKKLPFVVFHSFMGSVVEGESLLSRGINGYFSFGKQILNRNKKVIQCVQNLPLERLFLETDAPFQTLKGEAFTSLQDIVKIYEKAWQIRDNSISFLDFSKQIHKNLVSLFYE